MNNNNASTAVLSQITFAPQDGVTHEQAIQTLLQVVSKHFKQVLHVDLKEHLLTKSTTTTMVNILLWFRSAKEANEKKIILEENRPALELELQRTSAFLTVLVKEPETYKHVSAMIQPPSLSPAPPTEAPALEAPPAPGPRASSPSFSLGPHINGTQGCYVVPRGEQGIIVKELGAGGSVLTNSTLAQRNVYFTHASFHEVLSSKRPRTLSPTDHIKATTTKTTAEITASVSNFTGDDGTVTFMVDHVAVGRVTATKIDIVSPGYAEYVYRNGALELQSDIAVEAHCAYSGVAEDPTVFSVSLFTCGHMGPRITITFFNSTVLQMMKASAFEQMDGVYIAKRKQEGRFSTNVNFNDIGAQHGRRSLLSDVTGQPKVLYFNYVFVSDKKRYEKFDKSTHNVTADTIEEVAMMNAIFLIGNRFSPQIQFQIATQIIWTDDTPSQFSANMIRFAGLFAPDGDIFLDNFHKWVLETTYFNVTGWLASGVAKHRGNFTEYLVTGHHKDLGDRADGWHLLTGYDELLRINKKSETSSHQVVSGIATIDGMCVNHITGCHETFLELDREGRMEDMGTNWSLTKWGAYYAQLWKDSLCYPNLAVGFTSPDNRFSGLTLAHELGHNLGFGHVYNDDPTDEHTGDIDGCMDSEPHNGSAVMGFTNSDSSISWSKCSVDKFRSNFLKGQYSCARTSSTALAEKFNPVGAHHLLSPPLSPPKEVANVTISRTRGNHTTMYSLTQVNDGELTVFNDDVLRAHICIFKPGVTYQFNMSLGGLNASVEITTLAAV